MDKITEKALEQGRKRRASLLSKFKRSGMNKAEFARQLGVSRQRVSVVLNRALAEAAQ